jgi:hypothetical protein
MKYTYPQLRGGYRFNLLTRIEREIGMPAVGTYDAQENGAWVTRAWFSRDLTADEKARLDALMAGSPTLPPQAATKFVIRDVWNQRATIGEAIGAPYTVYYSQSVPGGEVDQVELHFDRPLSAGEKARVIQQYAALIREA